MELAGANREIKRIKAGTRIQVWAGGWDHAEWATVRRERKCNALKGYALIEYDRKLCGDGQLMMPFGGIRIADARPGRVVWAD